MADGVGRFSDLVAEVPAISDRMLSERLKELQIEGVVVRTVLPERPVRVDRVIDSLRFAAVAHQAGIRQPAQVIGHQRLGDAELTDQLTDIRLIMMIIGRTAEHRRSWENTDRNWCR